MKLHTRIIFIVICTALLLSGLSDIVEQFIN